MKRITFIGDTTQHEFRDSLAWMREYCDLSTCGSIESACQLIAASDDLPQAIVVGQIRPGEFSPSEIERVRLRVPNARLLRLLGGWCGGELRTSCDPLELTTVYWHQFFTMLADDLRSASATETVTGLVVIRTLSHDAYDAISGICDSFGHSTVWVQPDHPSFATQAFAGIWDCRNSISADSESLAEFVRRLTPAPVIAMLGFPRREDSDIAFSAGVGAVVSKPYNNDDLGNTLARVTASNQASRRGSHVRLASVAGKLQRVEISAIHRDLQPNVFAGER